MPQPVKTYLESTDMSGKMLHVVVTHGGSGFGQVKEDLPKVTGAEIDTEMLDIYDDDARESSQIVYNWLKDIYSEQHDD